LKTVLTLVVKEYKLLRSDRVALSLTFLIPILLIALWGVIFGKGDSGPTSLRLAFLNASNSPFARNIEKVLDTTTTFLLIKSQKDDREGEKLFDTTSIKEYVRRGDASAALVIPADAFTDTSLGMRLRFYYDPKNEMEMQVIQGVLTQTIMSQLPNLFTTGMQRRATRLLGMDSGKAFNRTIASTVGRYFKIDVDKMLSSMTDTSASSSENSAAQRDFFKNILDFQTEQLVGKEIANPWATRSVGGWAMMFLLFTLTATSTSLFEEKESGVVLRILASPISRVQILWSKYLYNASLGIIQIIVLFSAGALLFRIDIFSNLFNLLLVVVAAVTACTAFGMLLAAMSRSRAQASSVGMFLILAMSSIGGAWFPTSFMPDIVQYFSKMTIVYWAMDAFLQVLWRGSQFSEIFPNICVLFGMAIVITAVSVWQFKKGHVF